MLIVLEGGEGSGKTTVLHAVGAALRAQGHDVVLTREPGGTSEGLELRALLLAADGPAWEPMAELLLMMAARVQHVTRVIRPALAAGRIVLCDRFIGSTIAYQGAGRGIPEAFIADLHRQTTGGLMPDLTVLLDVDPRVGLARSVRRLGNARANEGRFEALDLAFHDRVRASFLSQSGPSLTVDASAPAHIVQDQVVPGILAAIANRS